MTFPYQEFPPALRLLTPRTTVGGDVASSIAGINTTELPDGCLVVAQENYATFVLQKGSTEAPDGIKVIAPVCGGPGRWYRVAPLPNVAYNNEISPFNVNTASGVITLTTGLLVVRQNSRIQVQAMANGDTSIADGVISLYTDLPAGGPHTFKAEESFVAGEKKTVNLMYATASLNAGSYFMQLLCEVTGSPGATYQCTCTLSMQEIPD